MRDTGSWMIAIYVVMNIVALVLNPMALVAVVVGLPILWFGFYWFVRLVFNIDLWK